MSAVAVAEDGWGRIRRPRVADDWEREVQEELEVMGEADVVFVIINSWEPEGGDYLTSEIVSMSYFETLDEAWCALLEIADAHGYPLAEDEVGFQAAPTQGITYQEYYIEELYHG